jgi:hypothetical protein
MNKHAEALGDSTPAAVAFFYEGEKRCPGSTECADATIQAEV